MRARRCASAAKVEMSRRAFVRAALATGALLAASPVLSACSSGDEGPVGTWYGVDDEGTRSTLEINEGGTWLYTGSYSGNGEWSETDGGTIVLSASLISIPFEVEGTGDGRVLVFAGDDPSSGNAPEISGSTFYATEEAREAASGGEG